MKFRALDLIHKNNQTVYESGIILCMHTANEKYH